MNGYALIADADDDQAAAWVVTQVFQEVGLTYFAVRDGADAVAVLDERGAPQILVTDITLPRVDGIALIAHLRGIPDGKATAVLVISSDREARDRIAELRALLDIGAVLSRAASSDSIRRVLDRLLPPGKRAGGFRV
jgi:CheY-like chemotaxis protein